MIEPQQLGQSPGVNLVALVAFPHGLVFPRIAHHHSRDVWLQKVVEPGRRSSFFKGDVQIPAQPVDKLQNHAGFRFDEAFHHDLPGRIPHGDRNAVLVHIHGNVFATIHRGCSFLSELRSRSRKLLQRGAPLSWAKNFALRGSQSDFFEAA